MNKTSRPNVLDDMNADHAAEILGHCIVNQLGINLCAVDRIKVTRRPDRQIEKVVIDFIPADNPD